jgi:hypothetical protein
MLHFHIVKLPPGNKSYRGGSGVLHAILHTSSPMDSSMSAHILYFVVIRVVSFTCHLLQLADEKQWRHLMHMVGWSLEFPLVYYFSLDTQYDTLYFGCIGEEKTLHRILANLVSSTGVLFHQLYSNHIVNSILIFSRNGKTTIFFQFFSLRARARAFRFEQVLSCTF